MSLIAKPLLNVPLLEKKLLHPRPFVQMSLSSGRKERYMGRRQPSLWNFLELHKAPIDDGARQAWSREQLVNSELLVMMERIADEVNTRARGLVIDVQTYLAPEPLVRSFSFKKGDKDFALQLESWGPSPAVAFIMRQWRGPLLLGPFGWILRLLGVQEYVMNIKYRSPVAVQHVTEAEVEKWFTYLISGFDRAFAPFGFRQRHFLALTHGSSAEMDWRSSIPSVQGGRKSSQQRS